MTSSSRKKKSPGQSTESASPNATIQVKSQGTTESHGFLGLRWYWWVLIIVVFIIIMSSISAGMGSGCGVVCNLSKGLLGFMDGMLNMLSGSGIFWFFAIIFAFPFLGQGLSSVVKSYKDHFAEGKSQEDINKDLNITKEDLQKAVEEAKNANKGMTPEELTKYVEGKVKSALNQNNIDLEAKRQQELIENSGKSPAEAQRDLDSFADQNNEDAKKEAEKGDYEFEPGKAPILE